MQSLFFKTSALIILFATVSMAACSNKGQVPNTGYLEDPGRMTASKRYPFNRQWYDSNVNWAAFDKVYIPPVDIKHLKHLSWWQKASLDSDLNRSAEELARYTRVQFQDAFRNSKGRFSVVNAPGPNVLVIEIGIVELVPTKAWLNTIEFAAAFMAFDKGFTALESRMRDGGTGKVIATIADGESGRTTLFSGADFTWWGHSKNTIEYLAKTFEEVLDDGWQGRVSSRSSFALVTW